MHKTELGPVFWEGPKQVRGLVTSLLFTSLHFIRFTVNLPLAVPFTALPGEVASPSLICLK